ncbi:YpiF family protein [Oceanobacillus massiliensis]|uniref:YpiF family protein n=1 Tax=Oceanobacillus massiliensis TaxID=1465765 RepID=UPI00028973C0|nr:YpiF family protein [Oceanobacillus massiliensis]
MKWRKSDLQTYVQAKEYIDTVIIPLIPFQMSGDAEAEKYAQQAEAMTIFAQDIEKELTGRIMLAPPYHYLKSAKKEDEINRLNAWGNEITEQPFSHILLITFDSSWKKQEKDLSSHLLWMPAVQTEDINSKEMQRIIRDQVGQTVELIRSFWQ